MSDTCEHFILELDHTGTQYECTDCGKLFDKQDIVITEGGDTCVNTQRDQRYAGSVTQERGDTMNTFDTSSLPSNNTVSRAEAGAWIARQAEEQGIGNSFKVYYNGNVVGKLEDLPDQVNLNTLRVSAALDQAGVDTWFVLNEHAHALVNCR